MVTMHALIHSLIESVSTMFEYFIVASRYLVHYLVAFLLSKDSHMQDSMTVILQTVYMTIGGCCTVGEW